MNRRDFIKELGGLAVKASAFSILTNGALLRRVNAEPVRLDDLRKAISSDEGLVVGPGDGSFDKYKSGFNLRIQIVPQVIVLPKGSAAITKAIQWARANHIPVRVRGGGHSYEGYSTGECLVIDMRLMNSIQADRQNQSAILGTGARLGNVYESLFAKNLCIPAGSCPSVGVAGLTLGGGHGMHSRKMGLTTDNLLSLKMVNAKGELLNVSPSENPDLYWACRGGGGGNFGVATQLEFRAHRIDRVITFSLSWSLSQAKSAFQAYQSFIPSCPDEVAMIFKYEANSSGVTKVKVVGQFTRKNPGENPSESELQRVLRPLLAVGSPQLNFKTRTLMEAVSYFSGGEDPPIRFKAKSDYAREPLSGAGIDALLGALKGIKSGGIAVIFDAYGGAINRIPSDGTAFAHRDMLYCVQYYTQWDNSSQTQSRLDMIRSIYAPMRPHFSGHCYVNYCDLDVKDWQKAYFGSNFDRLTQVKLAYDPENVFGIGAQSIPLPSSG